jgi:hypothetical protein
MQFCPFCFHKIDSVSALQGKQVPEPEDFTICIECGGVMKLDANMTLLASSLLEIPMHSRLDFAKTVTLVKEKPWKR